MVHPSVFSSLFFYKNLKTRSWPLKNLHHLYYGQTQGLSCPPKIFKICFKVYIYKFVPSKLYFCQPEIIFVCPFHFLFFFCPLFQHKKKKLKIPQIYFIFLHIHSHLTRNSIWFGTLIGNFLSGYSAVI